MDHGTYNPTSTLNKGTHYLSLRSIMSSLKNVEWTYDLSKDNLSLVIVRYFVKKFPLDACMVSCPSQTKNLERTLRSMPSLCYSIYSSWKKEVLIPWSGGFRKKKNLKLPLYVLRYSFRVHTANDYDGITIDPGTSICSWWLYDWKNFKSFYNYYCPKYWH